MDSLDQKDVVGWMLLVAAFWAAQDVVYSSIKTAVVDVGGPLPAAVAVAVSIVLIPAVVGIALIRSSGGGRQEPPVRMG